MQVSIVCRFIPGGRTAVTLSCGLIGYQRRRFVVVTAVAAVIWALYAFFIGRLGGKAFEDRPRAGFFVAFGGTVLVSALIEAARRIRSRRKAAWTTQRVPGTRPYWHLATLMKARRIAGDWCCIARLDAFGRVWLAQLSCGRTPNLVLNSWFLRFVRRCVRCNAGRRRYPVAVAGLVPVHDAVEADRGVPEAGQGADDQQVGDR